MPRQSEPPPSLLLNSEPGVNVRLESNFPSLEDACLRADKPGGGGVPGGTLRPRVPGARMAGCGSGRRQQDRWAVEERGDGAAGA